MLKTLIGKFLIVLVISHSFLAYTDTNNVVVGHKHKKYPRGVYKQGNPGLMLMLEQESIMKLKYAFQDFFPHYINHDLKLPERQEFDIGLGDFAYGIFQSHVEWSEIQYKNITLDIVGTKVEFTNQDELGDKIHITFPGIQEWWISAYQHVDNPMIGLAGEIWLYIEGLKADIVCELSMTEDGYLHAVFNDISIDFGTLDFGFDNWVLEFLAWQTMFFTKIMIENSIYLVGPYLLTEMGGPPINRMLNGYQVPLTLHSPVDSGDKVSTLINWDLRQTRDPFVGMGYIYLFAMGQLTYAEKVNKDKKDPCVWDPKVISFMDPGDKAETYSQFAISENAMTCSLNAISISPIGNIKINEKKLNHMLKMFKVPEMKMDTSAMAKYLPLFREKLGAKKQMKAEVSFKKIDVKFGEFDTDVIISYTVCLSFMLDKEDSKILMYDELKVVTTGDIKQEDNVLWVKILTHKLDTDNKYTETSYPVKDNMKMSQNQYREFLSTFGFYLNKQKEFFNKEVLGKGLHLPMGTDEIKVKLGFQEGSMHLFLEIMKDAGEWLETEWWDKDYKEQKGVKDHDDAAWDWKDGETWDERSAEQEASEKKAKADAKKKKDLAEAKKNENIIQHPKTL